VDKYAIKSEELQALSDTIENSVGITEHVDIAIQLIIQIYATNDKDKDIKYVQSRSPVTAI